MFFLLFTLLGIVYEPLMIAHWGATLGKKAMGIKVLALDTGQVPGGAKAILRAVSMSGPLMVPIVGWLWWFFDSLFCVFDNNRQCMHDKGANTIVVVERERGAGAVLKDKMNTLQDSRSLRPTVQMTPSGVPSQLKSCASCQSLNPATDAFCGSCGSSIATNAAAVSIQ